MSDYDKPISDLRRRMIADMTVRSFSDKTQHDYIRHVEAFARFLGRSPDTATGDDIRRFQLVQVEQGAQPSKMNAQRFYGEDEMEHSSGTAGT
jgi:integrase/recombinase XerD